jgi:hypothetical protein
VNPWSGIRRSTNAWEQTHHQPTERDRSIRKRRGKLANSNRESKRTSPTSLLLSPPLRCSGRVSDISGRWEDSSSEWEWLPASVAKYMQQPTGERRVLREGAGRVASAGSTFTCTGVRRPLPIRRHGWRLLAAEEIGVLTVGWQWRVLSCVTNSNGLLGCQWTCLAGSFWFSPGSCDMPRQHVLRVPVLVDPV